MADAGDDVMVALGTLPIDMAARLAVAMPAEIRRHVRDRAVQELRAAHYGGLPRTAAAKAMAAALDSPDGDPDRASALRRVLLLNGGRRLSWRQLADVLDGWRGW